MTRRDEILGPHFFTDDLGFLIFELDIILPN